MAYGDLPLDAPEKPNKGHEGGACNRRACQAEPALWWNHGSYSWYCADCARDIGQDVVNLRDWTLRWEPQVGHPQFETREMMEAREGQYAVAKPARQQGKTAAQEGTEAHSYILGQGRLYFDPPLKRPAEEPTERRYHVVARYPKESRQVRRAREARERKEMRRG